MKYYLIINEKKPEEFCVMRVIYGSEHFGEENEITEEEYNTFLAEIREKAWLVDALYNGEITLENVPREWQEEIQRRVNERIEMMGTLEEQPISSDEFYSMIEGVL